MRYSAVITDHFENPRHVGPLPGAHAVGESTNASCLDFLRLSLRLDARRTVIEAASFEAEGCVPSLAVGSFLAAEAVGKSLAELRALASPEALEAALGGLPTSKKHAAHLGAEALEAALDAAENWERA